MNPDAMDYLPQHFLYFFPLPHGQGSFLPTFFSLRTVPEFFCSLYNSLLRSASIADELSASAVTRGIDNPDQRTSFVQLKVTPKEVR